MKVETARWSKKQNGIISLADTLAHLLADLSSFHLRLNDGNSVSAETKKGFITTASRIRDAAQNLTNKTRALADACSDLRLKSQLNGSLDKIMTFVQQLKIIAAVKASSPDDLDSEVQLITCARNLINAVKTGLRDAESASLRSGDKETVRFTRTIYRKAIKSENISRSQPSAVRPQ